MIHEAFGAESRRLSEVVTGLDDAAFTQPTPCEPWTVADLVYHVRMTMGRLPGMLAAPDPAGADLVTAAGYYRGISGSPPTRTPSGSGPPSAGPRAWPVRRPGRATSMRPASEPGWRCGPRRRGG